MKNRGFTLIELLVVISIISLLSSVVVSSLNSARAKARDAKVKSELRQVKLALSLYIDKFGTMPPLDDPLNPSPHVVAFNDMTNKLVLAGFLASVPVPPANHSYQYYDYGPGNTIGGILVTTLETAAETYQPYPGTCRPWNNAPNWCDVAFLSTYYCICNPY